MRLIHLLRLPAPGFPMEAATGDPTLDAFLRDTDGRLVGSASIRRPSLMEVADHLVEARDRALETGASTDEASRIAVEEYGDPEPLAAAQRRARARIFWLVGIAAWLWSGIMTALLLVLLQWTDWTLLWFLTVLPQGPVMGYGFAYAIGPPSMPRPGLPGREVGRSFTVALRGGPRLVGFGLLLGTAVVGSLVLTGLLGWGLFAEAPWGASLFVLVMAGLALSVTGPVLVHIEVGSEGFGYRSALREVQVRWDQVVGVEKESGLFGVLRPPIGPKVRLRWCDEPDGPVSEVRMRLDGSMINVDRLLAALDRHAPQASSRPSGRS
jgi:hypothetical protein